MSGNGIEKESRPLGTDGMREGNGLAAVSSERNNSTDGEGVKVDFAAAALCWAEKGWPVFPVVPNGKKPATAHGFKDASSRPWLVSGAWSGRPDCNIGLATGGGLVVLDIDRKGDKDGFAALERVGLTAEQLDELTFGVDTPSGGRHYYFASEGDVSSGADVLGRGSGVDVRGVGGYVVAPPSIVDGKPYTVRPGFSGFFFGKEVPERRLLADWSTVAPYLRKPEPPATPPPSNLPPSPSGGPSVLERAAAYLRTVDPAVEGKGGSNATFRPAVALVHGFQLAAEDAFALLRDEFNPRCSPPWSEKELRHKVEDAVKAGPPAGKAPGWLAAGGEVRPATVAPPSSLPPVVEVEDSDEDADEDESDEGTVENIEDVPPPPGIVGETVRWILARCGKPYRPFAVQAALVVWSVLGARKARVQNQTPILYVGEVAASSNGKDDPQRLAAAILEQAGVSLRHFGGRLASWNAGIEEFLRCWAHPVMFSRVDEAAGYLGQVSKSDFAVSDFLKESWSRGLGKLYPLGRVKLKGKETLAAIHHPALNVFLATQPSTLGAAVGRAQLEDGLLPRVLWACRPGYCVDVETANLCRPCDLRESEEGLRILDRARRVWNWFRGKPDYTDFRDMADLESRPAPDAKPKGKADEDEGGGLPPAHAVWDEPLPFELEPQAAGRLRDFMRRTQNRVKLAAEGKASPLGYLWGKAAENALRVSLILAVARLGMTAGPYTITDEETAWAVRFVEASVWSAIVWARANMADNPFERDCKRVLEFIRGGDVVKKSSVTRRFRLPSRLLDDILVSLASSGDIEAVVVRTKGRAADGYRAVSKRGRRK
jgi:hypothetical protein